MFDTASRRKIQGSNYMNKDNMLQQVVGLPDKEKLHIMMGEKE